MSQHTPGPWYANDANVYAEYVQDGDRIKRWVATVSAEGDMPRPVDYANARLIALAPEMAEALRYFVEMMDAGPIDAVQDAYHQARALLARLDQ